jgi:hypothetical protein
MEEKREQTKTRRAKALRRRERMEQAKALPIPVTVEDLAHGARRLRVATHAVLKWRTYVKPSWVTWSHL